MLCKNGTHKKMFNMGELEFSTIFQENKNAFAVKEYSEKIYFGRAA
jgi:hypothetical protein